MPAKKKISDIRKIGIIAGGGMLPVDLALECRNRGIETYMVGFKGQTDPVAMELGAHKWMSLGAVGLLISTFKDADITDLILIGSIKRPSLSTLKPDLKAAQILARISFRALGDSSLLSALKKELETEGFTLHGFHEFCGEHLAQEGLICGPTPNAEQESDIQIGIAASQDIGSKDIGQSVVVRQGCIIGVEDAEGTDALIRRCASSKESNANPPILVKTCKPQQDRNLDMPTIGINTITAAHESGFAGIVIQAGATLLVQPKEIADMANQYNIFIKAVLLDDNANTI
jgi:UDP-2,3-diacylglucosamine hydrolase